VKGVDATGNLTMSGSSRYFSFGGYWEPRYSNDTSPAEPFSDDYRYFADLYLDTTWQRVMICTGSTWAAKGTCEMQIPNTTWNDTSIQVTVNRGAYGSTDSAYLYVVDSNGDGNSTGQQITFGEGGTGATHRVTGVINGRIQ